MTAKTTTVLRRWAKGIRPKKAPVQQKLREKGCTLSEYLETRKVPAFLPSGADARTRLQTPLK